MTGAGRRADLLAGGDEVLRRPRRQAPASGDGPQRKRSGQKAVRVGRGDDEGVTVAAPDQGHRGDFLQKLSV